MLEPADLLMILALIAGPFIGIYAQKRIEIYREHKSKQLDIFRTLMATRNTPIAVEHVKALNLIDIDFSAKDKKEKPVIDAWTILLHHLNTGYPNHDIYKDKIESEYSRDLADATKKSREYLENLLDEMSKCLGYDFERLNIKRDSYFPAGHAEKENDEFLIRKGILNAIQGHVNAGMNVKDLPEEILNTNEKKILK